VPIAYEDFVVQFQALPASGEPMVSVDSPAGQGRGALALPLTEISGLVPELTWELRSTGRPSPRTFRDLARASGRDPSPREVGAALFRAIFSGLPGKLYERSRGRIDATPESGLRIQIRLSLDDPRLARLVQLPWELLYDPERAQFLARGDRRIVVVRFLGLPTPVALRPFKPPLRILIAAAGPANLPDLGYRQESKLIARAWSVPDAEVAHLQSTTLPSLRTALLAAQFDVLHFIGHGTYDPQTGEGALILEGTARAPDPVRGQLLAQYVADLGLRVVVLNACNTARISAAAVLDPMAGVASALMHGGVPAVIAMQLPISDTAAITFSASLYGRLAAGDSLDTAVTEARLAVLAADRESCEWATPVVYMRATDGAIFGNLHDAVKGPGTRPQSEGLSGVAPTIPRAHLQSGRPRRLLAPVVGFAAQAVAWSSLSVLVLAAGMIGPPYFSSLSSLTSLAFGGVFTAGAFAVALLADRTLAGDSPALRRLIQLAAFLVGIGLFVVLRGR
jgi:hypothetical protein